MQSQQLKEILSTVETEQNSIEFHVRLGDRLINWNDEIEKSFADRSLNDAPSSVKDTAKALHSMLMSFLLTADPLQCNFQSNENTSRNTEKDEGDNETLDVSVSFSGVTNNDGDDEMKPDRIAMTISNKIIISISLGTKVLECNDSNIRNINICTQLVRASKNLIRWNRILLMQSANRFKSNVPVSGNDSYVSSAEHLCSPGMISLYMNVLKMTLCKLNIQEKVQVQTTALMKDAIDDLARQCSIALFHSTFSQAPEPCCRKALKEFVMNLNGLQFISRLLVEPVDCSINVMLSLMKNLLNLVFTVNNAMEKVDNALSLYGAELQQQGNVSTSPYKLNIFTTLVATLAWSLRSGPFPPKNQADRRPDLVVEIIRVLYALRSNSKNVQIMESDENQEMMTQMGVVIVDILKLPHRDKRIYDCKLVVLQLLIDCPKDYGNFLIVNNAIDELLSIFWFQLNTIVVEGAGDVQSERNATVILPVLLVLNHLVSSNEAIRSQVKNFIFPTKDETNFMAKVEEYQQTIMNTPANKRGAKKNMHPIDAPNGTTRYKLIKLMTWTESNVKRNASELLWNICEKNPNEFMLRCGFGNAVHLLGIKGLYKIPK